MITDVEQLLDEALSKVHGDLESANASDVQRYFKWCIAAGDRALLNDPQLIEAADALAKNLLQESDLTDEDRVVNMFRMITSRYPDKSELEDLIDFLEISVTDYEKHEKKSNGEFSTQKVEPDELYAYTMLANLIFNLDEAIIKG